MTTTRYAAGRGESSCMGWKPPRRPLLNTTTLALAHHRIRP